MVTSSYLNFYSKKEKKFLFDGEVKVKIIIFQISNRSISSYSLKKKLKKVRVLPPFQTKGMTSDSVNQLTKHLHEAMQKEYDLLNKEIRLDEKYYTKKVAPIAVSELDVKDELNESVMSNLEETEGSEKLNMTQNDDNNNSIIEEDMKKFN